MKALHNRSNMVPGAAGFPFRNPHQQQGKEAEEDMGMDTLVLPVIDGSEFKGGLERPEGPLHLQVLLVAEGDILGSERVIAGVDEVLAVKVGVLPDPAPVYGAAPVLELSDVPAHGPMRQQGADRLLVDLPLLVSYGSQGFFYPPDDPLPGCPVTLDFLGVEDQDEAPAALAFADDHLLGQHVLPNLLVSPSTGEDLLVDLPGIPELLSHDVMAARLLDGKPVLLTVHPPVRDPDTPGEPPAQQIVLDLLDGGHVLGVAGQGPALHRDPFLGHGKADHHLGEIRTVILRVTIPAQSVFVLLIPLDIRARSIEEEQVYLQVQQIGSGEEHLLVDVLVLEQDIHGPVEVLELYRLGIPQCYILSHPFLHPPLGVRGQRPVGNHGEYGPLHWRSEPSLLQASLQDLVDPQLFPQGAEQVGAPQGCAPDELQGIFSVRRDLCSKGILRGKKSAEASDESSDRIHIQAVSPTEGIEHIRPWISAFLIPDIMGELYIGGGCTVLVLPGDRSHVHASSNSMYYMPLQALNAIAHAYSFFDFWKDKPACFLDSLLKKTPKMCLQLSNVG